MDFILLIGIAISLIVLLLTLLFFRRKTEEKEEKAPVRRPEPVRVQPSVGSRAQAARNQRNRATQATASDQRRAAIQQNINQSDDEDTENISSPVELGTGKIGAKKRAKLEAKAEKKAHREVELQMREDKKKREALVEEERKKIEEKEMEEERKREEAERLARELKEKQEYEEYLKMKATFMVEEEGYDENEDDGNHNFLREFVDHIKNNKVVVLEELANEFKLKTQAVIDRIHDLKSERILTGVIDDRGKFIYISEDELQMIAKFIRQRGRISITELVESSNDLINLTPIETI